ncbi:MAG: PilZ domain-containing protein, partial [Vulcanimicrobiota bacterium]
EELEGEELAEEESLEEEELAELESDLDEEELDEEDELELEEDDLEGIDEVEIDEEDLEDDEELEDEELVEEESLEEEELAELEVELDEEELEGEEDLEDDEEFEDEELAEEESLEEEELAELEADLDEVDLDDEEELELEEDDLEEIDEDELDEEDLEDDEELDDELDDDEFAELEEDLEELGIDPDAEVEDLEAELAELDALDEALDDQEELIEVEPPTADELLGPETTLGEAELLGAPDLVDDAEILFSGPAEQPAVDFFSGPAQAPIDDSEFEGRASDEELDDEEFYDDEFIEDLDPTMDEVEDEPVLEPPTKEYRSSILEALRKVQRGTEAQTRADVLSVLEAAVPAELRRVVSERRRLVRLSCEYEVNCYQGNQIFHATIRDISLGGMKIEATRQLEQGSHLEVSNPARKEGQEDQRVTAQVRWFRVNNDGKAEAGLQFVDPPEVLGRSWVVSLLNRVGMQSQVFNQRKYTRAVADFPVDIVTQDDNVYEGRCVDLGLGGALVDTAPIFEAGDTVTFRCLSFGIHGLLEAESKIVKVKDMTEDYGTYALEFQNLDAATTKLLGRYVVDLLKLGRTPRKK